jgi:fructokinase
MFPGGAPLNVAYHLNHLGYRAAPVTAVGRDALGVRLLEKMLDWGLDTTFLRQVDHSLTGIIKVSIDRHGNAQYEIQEGAAWDWIIVDETSLEAAGEPDAVVFGTLALRSSHNREELSSITAKCPRALRVDDVNLRPPYTRHETVYGLAKIANVIKLSGDELNALTPRHRRSADLRENVARFALKTGCRCVCVTLGGHGASLLIEDDWHSIEGESVEVADTVGAGDAFVASLIDGLLSERPVGEILNTASDLAKRVALRPGATTLYASSKPEPFPTPI